jgi:hypothetical protein
MASPTGRATPPHGGDLHAKDDAGLVKRMKKRQIGEEERDKKDKR